MGMFSKIVIASALSFSAISAKADTLVNCVGIKDSTTTLSYIIKGTESKRLGSDLTYFKNGNGSLISSLNVAQYVATNVLLHILIDDSAEDNVMRFTAAPIGKNWIGALETLSTPKSSVALKCTLSTI